MHPRPHAPITVRSHRMLLLSLLSVSTSGDRKHRSNRNSLAVVLRRALGQECKNRAEGARGDISALLPAGPQIINKDSPCSCSCVSTGPVFSVCLFQRHVYHGGKDLRPQTIGVPENPPKNVETLQWRTDGFTVRQRFSNSIDSDR